MERIAVFPGSFDPFTIGHESIVRRAIPLFDRIIVAIGENSSKSSFFPIEKRMQWIEEVFQDDETVSVSTYQGLTVEYCKNVGALYLLRGLRTSADFEYERMIAQVNRAMVSEIESIFLLTEPEYSAINSTIVREIIRAGGDASQFLPNSLDLKSFKI